MKKANFIVATFVMGSTAWAQTSTTLGTNTASPGSLAPGAQVPAPPANPQNNPSPDVTNRIRQDLLNDPRISSAASGVSITTLNGQIILRGQVPSRGDAEDIANRVRSASGSSNISNELTIAPTFHQ